MSTPPSYASSDIAPPPYSKEEAVKIQVAAAKEFATNPKVKAALEVDIDRFTETLNCVNDDFRTVSLKLGEIDSKGLTSEKYQARWDKFYARYQSALTRSRRSANEIADNSNDFNSHYLPYVCGKIKPTDSKEKRLTDLRHYINDLKESEKEATAIQKEFNDLSTDIIAFKNSFVHFAEKEIEKTTGEVSQLRLDVAALKSKISELTKKFAILLGAIAVVAIAGLALAIIFPVFAGVIGTATLTALGVTAKKAYDTYEEKSKATEELAKKEKELKQKTDKLDELQKAHDQLKKLGETEITRVVAGVNMLSDIWSRVYDDCVTIEKYLVKTERAYADFENDPDAPAVIVSYLQSGYSVYNGLGEALKAYATGVQRHKTA